MAGEQKFSIGRDRKCDIPIVDDSVSRLHAEMWFPGGGQILLEDKGSSNGTTLIREGQRRRITVAEIFATDLVIFGSAELAVRDMLDAIRIKYPVLFSTPQAQPGNGPRKLQCICGALKNEGEYCTSCGYKES